MASGLTPGEFYNRLQRVKKIRNMEEMLGDLPGLEGVDFASAVEEIPRLEAIILAMTPEERADPGIMETGVLDGGRLRRIAADSGTTLQDVNHLLAQFRRMP